MTSREFVAGAAIVLAAAVFSLTAAGGLAPPARAQRRVQQRQA